MFHDINTSACYALVHDDVIKWKHSPRYCPFMRGIHRSTASDAELWWFFFICAQINGWVINRKADDLKCHRTHYDVIVMLWCLYNLDSREMLSIFKGCSTGTWKIVWLPHWRWSRAETPFIHIVYPAWISNYVHDNVCDVITDPFPDYIGASVEVWEWMNNFIPHLTPHMITYPCWDQS